MHSKLRTFIKFDIRLYGSIQENTFEIMRKDGLKDEEISRIEKYNNELKQRKNIKTWKK